VCIIDSHDYLLGITISSMAFDKSAPSVLHHLLCRFEQAEEDCNKALGFELSPNDKAKALLRRGTARMHLYRGPQALQDFQAVLSIEPNNRQAKEEIKVCWGTWEGVIGVIGAKLGK
jgi:tetratricopeptide (TPR) repeat protein